MKNIPKVNQRFGKWVFLGGDLIRPKKYGHLQGLFRCDCGRQEYRTLKDIVSGKSKKCRNCKSSVDMAKYHPLYSTWKGMHTRCYGNEAKCQDAIYYKNKGIKVCERWHRDNYYGLENFAADMGEKPSSKHSIDRIDNNGDYSPDNCRWADKFTQSRNRSNVRIYPKGHEFGWWVFSGKEKRIVTSTSSQIAYQVKCRCKKVMWRSKTSLTGGKSTKCKTCAMRLLHNDKYQP